MPGSLVPSPQLIVAAKSVGRLFRLTSVTVAIATLSNGEPSVAVTFAPWAVRAASLTIQLKFWLDCARKRSVAATQTGQAFGPVPGSLVFQESLPSCASIPE